ncbi:MAG: ankyrin repeat domain-containing protein [Akkermansia sp.]|nr:ankyrin repeat domain-containing protein [Akkermansia sp.]
MRISRSQQLLCLLTVTPALWALGPADIANKTIRLDMSRAQVSRSDFQQKPLLPWYQLDDITDFVIDFPDTSEFTDTVKYGNEFSSVVQVSYSAPAGNQAIVTLGGKDFSVQVELSYASANAGTATIAWHEAGDTRHFRNVSFRVQDDLDVESRIEFPEEIISTSPEYQLDDGLSAILQEIESTRYRGATERLYQKRLSSLLPLVMMMGNPSYTSPDYKGNTALHYACGLGHVELVRWLVDHGANLEIRTEKGASIDDCVGGGKNGEAIKLILQQARRERDYPLRGPQASEEEAAQAVAWLEKAFRCEDVNSPLYEIPSPDDRAQEHAEMLFLYVRQNREIPAQVDVTEPLGNLLTWLRDANVHRGMFTEALQKELYQVRAYKLHELQKAGKSLALLPHMIMVREAEGMPYDGATALYRAACEGNVELVSWLLEHGADTRLTDKHGNVVTELKNIPNEEAIRNLINWYKE